MLIMSQNGKALYNMDDVSKVHADGSGKKIVVDTKTGAGCAAEYRRPEHVETVVGMLASSYADGEMVFQFPSQYEVEKPMAHRSNVQSRRVSHGGS